MVVVEVSVVVVSVKKIEEVSMLGGVVFANTSVSAGVHEHQQLTTTYT